MPTPVFIRPFHPTAVSIPEDHTDEHLSNEAHNKEHVWTEKAWALLAILVPICILGFLSNVTVIWIFYKWRILRNRINLFVVNLAASNVAISIVSPPLVALPIFLAHTAKTQTQALIIDLTYRISASLFIMACYANAFATTAIALHRRRMILKPRAQTKTEKPSFAICLAMWGTSTVLATPELFRCAATGADHSDEVDETLPTLLGPGQRLAVELFRTLVQFLLVSGLMIFSYVSVFMALRKRSVIRAQFWRDKKVKPHIGRSSKSANSQEKTVEKRGWFNRRAKKPPSFTTGSWITNGQTTTTLAGRPQSVSGDGPELNTLSPPAEMAPLPDPERVVKTSRIGQIWSKMRERKFSPSDSKNVYILIATITVHFLCWSPYNFVRVYFAILEAANNADVARAPVLESFVLCVAVSSILHCPIFYTWFNRRNRQGLIACCAAIIPCRNSSLRRRLRDMAHQGDLTRYHLPIHLDSPKSRRRASKLQLHLQNSLVRSRSSGILELRNILQNIQQLSSSDSFEVPPTRRNSANVYPSSVCDDTQTDPPAILFNDMTPKKKLRELSTILSISLSAQNSFIGDGEGSETSRDHTRENSPNLLIDRLESGKRTSITKQQRPPLLSNESFELLKLIKEEEDYFEESSEYTASVMSHMLAPSPPPYRVQFRNDLTSQIIRLNNNSTQPKVNKEALRRYSTVEASSEPQTVTP